METSTTKTERSERSGDLSREAAAHLTLSRLLSIERPEKQREALRQILQGDQSTEAKVTAIKRLDAESALERQRRDEPDRPRHRVFIELPFSLAQMKRIAKLPQARVGFFRYLFRERPRILEYGSRTHILVQSILLPMVRLDPRLNERFGEELQKTGIKLLSIMSAVLERGWRLLSKTEYNYVAVFSKLCQAIVVSNLKFYKLSDEHLLKKLATVETLLDVLHAQTGRAETVVESIKTVLTEAVELPAAQIDEAVTLAKRVIYRDFELPSLFNFLLILNMIHARRFLTAGELIDSSLDSIVDASSFSAPESIRERISSFIEETRERILLLDRRRIENERVSRYIHAGTNETFALTELRHFYEQGTSGDGGVVFSRDRENVVLFIPRLLRVFDATFAPFLTGRLLIRGVEKGVIFAPSVFGSDVQRLRNIGARLDRLFFHFRSLSYRKYLQIKAGANVAIPLETEIVHQLDDARDIFLIIARRLDRFLTREQHGETDGRSRQPLQPVDLHAPSVDIPYAEQEIQALYALDGGTVREAFSYTILICYQIGVYLHDEELLESAVKGDEIRQMIKNQLALLERIADRQTYDELVVRIRAASPMAADLS